MNTEWLDFSKRIHAIAVTGLTYCENEYDIERYEELKNLSFKMMSLIGNSRPEIIEQLFVHSAGYQTPKVDVRAVIFEQDKILMVKEKVDQCWTLPGGWADVGLSPFENVCKEVREEAGIEVEPVRLLAVLDKKLHAHPPSPWYCYKLFILCRQMGGIPAAGMETLDVAFFGLENLPPLSEERITKEQIELLYKLTESQDGVWCD